MKMQSTETKEETSGSMRRFTRARLELLDYSAISETMYLGPPAREAAQLLCLYNPVQGVLLCLPLKPPHVTTQTPIHVAIYGFNWQAFAEHIAICFRLWEMIIPGTGTVESLLSGMQGKAGKEPFL